ncbi:MAG: hypothetical protein LUI87_04650 [Lachnospiraceae bacterium]|nr:hypothetical protein [Lachnospiraceae bacterium]
MAIDFEGLEASLDGDENRSGEIEILETLDEGKIIVWALTEIDEAENNIEVFSEAFENLDADGEFSNTEVLNAAMEYVCGRTVDGSMPFYETLRQMEKNCTVLNRPIEEGRAAGCLANGGCAMILGDQTILDEITGAVGTPVAVGGIGLLPICAAGTSSVRLLHGESVTIDDQKLKEMGCRLVEVYK